MSAHPTNRTALRRRFFRQLAATSAAATLVAIAAGAARSNAEPTEGGKVRVAYGPSQTLGKGTARTYVTLDADNRPLSVGVALTENALIGLPSEMVHGAPHAAMLTLPLPAAASPTGLNHVALQWNPMGHEPEHVWTLPHFDFHFYSIKPDEVMEIMPEAPLFEERASKLLDARYVPAGYVSSHIPMGLTPAQATIPMMGLHWIDPETPELKGKTFTSTFIYGSFEGKMIFWEPMITKQHIESVKTAPNATIVNQIKVPSTYQRPGYYPTKYTLSWDAAAKEYHISLDALVQQR